MKVPSKDELRQRILALEKENQELRDGTQLEAHLAWMVELSETCTKAVKMLTEPKKEDNQPCQPT